MRFKLLSLFLILAVSACTFQVEVLETQQPTETVVLADSLTPTSFVSQDLSATPPPLPTFTPTVSPSDVINAVSTFPPPAILPIVFSANATSQNVVGSIGAGSGLRYSLDAFGGQIMSVSILPEKSELQATFQLEIKGQDGVELCPLNDYSCTFWRGTLPATQEYFITITPQVPGVFSMRIAINPPGSANQYFDDADPQGKFTLSYSDEFAPAHFIGAEVYKFPPQLVLQYIDTQQHVPTNLSEAYFLLGSSDDPQQVSTCIQPISFGGPEEIVDEVTINTVNFTKSEGGGVAAGNIYEQIYYRTLYNGTCYEITYFIHYGNIGAYAPDTVKEFDRTTLLQKFDQTLSTLIFK